MSALIHDTAFGQALRLVSRGRYPKYLDEVYPERWAPVIKEDGAVKEKNTGSDGSSSEGEPNNQPRIISWDGKQDPDHPQVRRAHRGMQRYA